MSAVLSDVMQIPAKMAPWLEPRRHKIARGGRGGGKSRTVGAILVRRGARETLRVLCGRQIQKSIEESVYLLLKDEIHRQGLTPYYDIQKTRIIGKYTGTTFVFTGLQEHTKDSLKSYEDYDIFWGEEAASVSASAIEVLVPTFRKAGSELWWTYNPDGEDDPIHVMARNALASGDPDFLVVDINWRDNPWFPAELEKERQRMMRQNIDLYQHIWEGECRSATGILFKRDWFKRHDAPPKNLNIYAASDYAVTVDGGDSTEHGVAGMGEDGVLYFVDWWHGQTAPDVWIDAMFDLIDAHKPHYWFEEKGVILRSIEPFLVKEMARRRKYVRREGLASASNKADRALGFAAMASNGLVSFPKTEWADRVINQLCGFTGEAGRKDDAVDVCSLLARGLDSIHNAAPEGKAKKSPVTPFTEQWFAMKARQDSESIEREQRYYRP